MKIIIDDTWLDILELCKKIQIEEVGLRIEEDGIRIEEMDPSHVFLAEAEFTGKETGIKDFEERTPLFDTIQLFNTIDEFEDKVVMELEEGIAVITPLDSENSRTAEIGIKSRPDDEWEVPHPDLEHQILLEDVDVESHLSSARNIVIRGDTPIFRSSEGRLYFVYEGDTDSYQANLGESEEDFEIMYDEDYIESIDGSWNLHFGDGLPLKGVRETEGEIWETRTEFLLAPRVDTGEGEEI